MEMLQMKQFTSCCSSNRSRSNILYHLLLSAQRRRRLLSESDGFSLLEMVVVLAIIGILVAIQLPNVIGNTDKAKFIAAQTRISNAISECATSKTSGASERELMYSSNKFVDLVPSMEIDPEGYTWDRLGSRGCQWMRLFPTDSDGKMAVNQGYPILMAKLASGGRIVKVADNCRPLGTLDFTKDCSRWDPTNTAESNYRTGRDLATPNWSRASQAEDDGE